MNNDRHPNVPRIQWRRPRYARCVASFILSSSCLIVPRPTACHRKRRQHGKAHVLRLHRGTADFLMWQLRYQIRHLSLIPPTRPSRIAGGRLLDFHTSTAMSTDPYQGKMPPTLFDLRCQALFPCRFHTCSSKSRPIRHNLNILFPRRNWGRPWS
jgi:hypothetical protein